MSYHETVLHLANARYKIAIALSKPLEDRRSLNNHNSQK
jgi:hypothetical protein